MVAELILFSDFEVELQFSAPVQVPVSSQTDSEIIAAQFFPHPKSSLPASAGRVASSASTKSLPPASGHGPSVPAPCAVPANSAPIVKSLTSAEYAYALMAAAPSAVAANPHT